MVCEEKFKELLGLKKKLQADRAIGQYNEYWRQLMDIEGLTEEQFRELIQGVYIGYTVAYDVYLLKTWIARETASRKQFIERTDKMRKVKGK